MRDLYIPTTGLTSLWIAEGNMGEDVGKLNFLQTWLAGYGEYACPTAGSCSADHNNTCTNPISDSNFNAEMLSSELFTSADPHTLGASIHHHQYPQPETGSSSNLANMYPPRQASDGCKTNNLKCSIAEDKAARKRALDRQYRERLRLGIMQMKSNLKILGEEKAGLKVENDWLKQHNVVSNQILQSQAKEIDQLKTDLDRLKLEYKKQNALVQTLSQLLAGPDLQLENQRLRLENEQLRQNGIMDFKISQVLEENGKLRLENRVLRVQNDALCGKVINIGDDKNHEAEQAL